MIIPSTILERMRVGLGGVAVAAVALGGCAAAGEPHGGPMEGATTVQFASGGSAETTTVAQPAEVVVGPDGYVVAPVRTPPPIVRVRQVVRVEPGPPPPPPVAPPPPRPAYPPNYPELAPCGMG